MQRKTGWGGNSSLSKSKRKKGCLAVAGTSKVPLVRVGSRRGLTTKVLHGFCLKGGQKKKGADEGAKGNKKICSPCTRNFPQK